MDVSELSMTHQNRSSCERRSAEIAKSFEHNDSENDTAAVRTDNNNYVKDVNVSLQKRWTSSEDSTRPYNQETKISFLRRQGNIEDTETESPDIISNDQFRIIEKHSRGKTRYSDIHMDEEKIATKSLRGRRRKRSKRIDRRKFSERSRTADDSYRDRIDGLSPKHYSGEDNITDGLQRKKKNTSQADNEVPITEILKKAEENERIRYEEPVPLPELTTDIIYIQGKNGFSAVKIDKLKHALRNDALGNIANMTRREGHDFARTRTHTLIRVAITAQKFWKSTGFVFQGLLGGMALLHFVMSTILETYVDELYGWEKITLSKDLFAVLAWFFVALGTRDDMLLIHLESMEKYASNVLSSMKIEK
ncbi:hypothetical protein EAI_02985 [Harpegnathos saltator]|uniref:Uncharacterized protein n=1 Tax=Harpegnathos saltator TaxID=610380 RepID=E2BMF5_HARSA|nr:hypothetical protein EAI_02985 [Harpegnathos saltator]